MFVQADKCQEISFKNTIHENFVGMVMFYRVATCQGKLRVIRVASYCELRVVHFSLTSLSCHHVIFYRLAWMQLPVHVGKMNSVLDEERDDFLLRSQFKRYVIYVYSLWYSF